MERRSRCIRASFKTDDLVGVERTGALQRKFLARKVHYRII